MSGAWACAACIAKLDLQDAESNASTARGWCGAGGHEVVETMWWFEEAAHICRREIAAPAEPPPSARVKPQQLNFLEAL